MEEKYNTLEYYNKNAKIYCEQTLVSEIQEIYDAFLKELPPNAYILDFGCGVGRDSKYFIEKGYRIRAIDGSEEICKLATQYINQKVECMRFEELEEVNQYDGIWACASILHVEKEKLPAVFNRMIKALKENGVMFVSFKKGRGYQIKDGKYYNYLIKEELEDLLNTINQKVKIIDYLETLPTTKRVDKNTIWANFILKKFK